MIEYKTIIKIKDQTLRTTVVEQNSRDAWKRVLSKVEELEKLGIRVRTVKVRAVKTANSQPQS